VALAKNRNFLDRDGELSLDAGPFVEGLEYALMSFDCDATLASCARSEPVFVTSCVTIR
jgi:hypothetical protein